MNVSESVVSLISLGTPAAIAWLIISIIVRVSVDASSIWSFAHIVKKIFKLSPSFANGYSAFFVMLKSRVGALSASGDHVLPRSISGGLLPVSGMAVRPELTATGAFLVNHPWGVNSFCATYASKDPCGYIKYGRFSESHKPDCRPVTDLSSGNVFVVFLLGLLHMTPFANGVIIL